MSTRRGFLFCLAIAGAGAAAGSMAALAEVRTVAQATGTTVPERLALKGYDPVAYFTLATPTAGSSQYEYVHDGVRYRFANPQHMAMFKADPDKYAPQFGGMCTMNMAAGVRREADPTVWVISNGSLYVFAGSGGADRFRQHPQEALARASVNWQTLRPQ
ncbi:MAG: YHS domain-containing (seleno)protein [Reyranellaceae bacterium]